MKISRQYPPVPLLGVSVLCHRQNEVLLIKRGKPPFEGHWSLPGGMVEIGETLAEAAERELLEETGVTAELTVPVDTFDSIQRDDEGRVRNHFVLTVFCARYLCGETSAGDDAMEARWFLPRNLTDLITTPGTPERIFRLLAER